MPGLFVGALLAVAGGVFGVAGLALVVLAFVLVLLLLLLLLLLFLLRMVVEIFLQQIAVEACVFMRGVHRERAIVRLDRGLKLAALRQRVTAVVLPVGGIDRRERCGALLELSGTKLCGATPLGVVEQSRGTAGVLFLQCLIRALITTQPEVVPLERLSTRRRQQHHEQHATDPAAAEQQCEERQHGERQPRTPITPDVGLVLLLLAARERHVQRPTAGRREQRLEIAIVGRESREPAAAGAREPSQGPDVDLRNHDLTVAVVHEATLGLRDRRALLGADRQHAGAITVAGHVAHAAHVGVGDLGIRDQQYVAAAHARLAQQCTRFVETGGQRAAARRHDVGRDGADQRRDRARVRRQRRDRERVRREHNEPRLPRGATLEQIEQLQFRAREARRLDIAGVHRARQVERHHERLVGAKRRHRQPFPRGPGDRDHRDEPRQQRYDEREPVVAQHLGLEKHVTAQLRFDDVAPAARFAAPAQQLPQQPRADGQRYEPLRP